MMQDMFDFMMEMFLDWDNIEDYSHLVPDQPSTLSSLDAVSGGKVTTGTLIEPIPTSYEKVSRFDSLQEAINLGLIIALPGAYRVPMQIILAADEVFGSEEEVY